MRFPNDLTGLKFGRLTVVCKAGVQNQGKRGSRSMWLCKCDCGNEKVIVRNCLVTGNTRSCGCLELETKTNTHFKHGMAKSRLWKIWCGIKDRCNNPNNKSYSYYGGKGVKVCAEWASSENGFENFRRWAEGNGYSENLTIDRIDSNGNYEPCNCRWVTRKEQTRNRNITLKLSLAEIAEIEAISYQQAYDKFIRRKSVGIRD